MKGLSSRVVRVLVVLVTLSFASLFTSASSLSFAWSLTSTFTTSFTSALTSPFTASLAPSSTSSLTASVTAAGTAAGSEVSETPIFAQASSPESTQEQTTEPDNILKNVSTPELAQQWDAAYKLKNWPKAISLGKELCRREPGNSAFLYNLACCYARKGDIDAGIRTLTAAVDAGFENSMLLLSDLDLSPLRSDDRFSAISMKAQENREKSRAEFQTMAEASVPIIWTAEGHDATEPAPVIIALHPYGTHPEWIVDYWKSTARKHGAILLAPRAVRPVRDGFQWGSIDETLFLVGTGFEKVKEAYALDESRILLTGFSQGGYMAFNLGRLHGNVITSVLPMAGRYERELGDPELVPEDQRARFYLIAGTEDSAHASNVLAHEDLKAAGFDVKLREIDGLGHTFPSDHETELETALKFLWD